MQLLTRGRPGGGRRARRPRGGLAVAVHAIGDGANRAALNAFDAHPRAVGGRAAAAADRARPVRRRRRPAPLRRAGRDRLGAADPRDARPRPGRRVWGRASAAGLPLARPARRRRPRRLRRPTRRSRSSTRWPAIQAAVHRTLDEREPWRPDQRARRGRRDARPHRGRGLRGRRASAGAAALLPGYAADLVVLDTDIVAHPDRIAGARVVATMLDGRWVHGRPPW